MKKAVFSSQLSPFRNHSRPFSSATGTRRLHMYIHTTDEAVTTFADRPKTFWSSIDNQKLFLDQLAKNHNISSPEDWYKITADVQSHPNSFSLTPSFRISRSLAETHC